MSLRYVVLRHEGVATPHFDLMFETSAGSMLATWRADEWPVTSGTSLQRIGDHRRDYLEYEGPLSGNRGFVRRIAAGTHSIQHIDDQLIEVMLENGLVLKLRA